MAVWRVVGWVEGWEGAWGGDRLTDALIVWGLGRSVVGCLEVWGSGQVDGRW